MNTLTINLPDSVDPTEVRWEMARSLYERGILTVEQAASLAELAPTYFRMKLEGKKTGIVPRTNGPVRKGLDVDRLNEIARQMDVQESWEDLVAMIGK